MSDYLFIDGAYLRTIYEQQMKAFYNLAEAPQMQIENILSFTGGHDRIYYYDAINRNRKTRDGKPESDDDYNARIKKRKALFSYINTRPGFHVREGYVRRSPKEKRHKQKSVDVQLAVQALEHAARGNMQKAILIAGDLDFEPLLASLVRLGVRTRLIYAPRHFSSKLVRAADEADKMTLYHFHQWSSPSFQQNYKQVNISDGAVLPNPSDFELYKEAVWKNRKVCVYSPKNTTFGLLHVDRGDELAEPSIQMIYPITEKLPLAFDLTYGKVDWK